MIACYLAVELDGVVRSEEGAALAAELGIPFVETSAKEGHNVVEGELNVLPMIQPDLL